MAGEYNPSDSSITPNVTPSPSKKGKEKVPVEEEEQGQQDSGPIPATEAGAEATTAPDHPEESVTAQAPDQENNSPIPAAQAGTEATTNPDHPEESEPSMGQVADQRSTQTLPDGLSGVGAAATNGESSTHANGASVATAQDNGSADMQGAPRLPFRPSCLEERDFRDTGVGPYMIGPHEANVARLFSTFESRAHECYRTQILLNTVEPTQQESRVGTWPHVYRPKQDTLEVQDPTQNGSSLETASSLQHHERQRRLRLIRQHEAQVLHGERIIVGHEYGFATLNYAGPAPSAPAGPMRSAMPINFDGSVVPEGQGAGEAEAQLRDRIAPQWDPARRLPPPQGGWFGTYQKPEQRFVDRSQWNGRPHLPQFQAQGCEESYQDRYPGSTQPRAQYSSARNDANGYPHQPQFQAERLQEDYRDRYNDSNQHQHRQHERGIHQAYAVPESIQRPSQEHNTSQHGPSHHAQGHRGMVVLAEAAIQRLSEQQEPSEQPDQRLAHHTTERGNDAPLPDSGYMSDGQGRPSSFQSPGPPTVYPSADGPPVHPQNPVPEQQPGQNDVGVHMDSIPAPPANIFADPALGQVYHPAPSVQQSEVVASHPADAIALLFAQTAAVDRLAVEGGLISPSLTSSENTLPLDQDDTPQANIPPPPVEHLADPQRIVNEDDIQGALNLVMFSQGITHGPEIPVAGLTYTAEAAVDRYGFLVPGAIHGRVSGREVVEPEDRDTDIGSGAEQSSDAEEEPEAEDSRDKEDGDYDPKRPEKCTPGKRRRKNRKNDDDSEKKKGPKAKKRRQGNAKQSTK